MLTIVEEEKLSESVIKRLERPLRS